MKRFKKVFDEIKSIEFNRISNNLKIPSEIYVTIFCIKKKCPNFHRDVFKDIFDKLCEDQIKRLIKTNNWTKSISSSGIRRLIKPNNWEKSISDSGSDSDSNSDSSSDSDCQSIYRYKTTNYYDNSTNYRKPSCSSRRTKSRKYPYNSKYY